MTKKVLILGGYGVFGTRIARELGKIADIDLIISGRNLNAAEDTISKLKKENSEFKAQAHTLDITTDLETSLAELKPDLVIHTCGPFQSEKKYHVAKACIKHNINYIDLADARDFVVNFSRLDELAKNKGLFLISGASSVPGLSSAIVSRLALQLSQIDNVDIGIAPGFKTVRGIATIKAIMSYVGKPFSVWMQGRWQTVYGWQNIHRHNYPKIGKRWMANCNVPDLDLFPEYFSIKGSMRFYAGLEVGWMHNGLWLLSWLVRVGIIRSLQGMSATLSNISNWFLFLGSDTGAMHVVIDGLDHQGKTLRQRCYITAKVDDGPQIPCAAAVLLTKKYVRGELVLQGAMPCMNLFTVEEFMQELQSYEVSMQIDS